MPSAANPRSPDRLERRTVPTLHVVVPFYEEPGTLDACLRSVFAAPIPERWRVAVTLVNDGSSREATERAAAICAARGVRLLTHDRNRGKGAAIRTGFAAVLDAALDEDVVIIQDADLEYDPQDYGELLRPIVGGSVPVVFGNRWGRDEDQRIHRRIHRAMNRALTLTSNALSGLHVHDMECCYKLFRVPVLRAIMPALTEDRFGIEPQIAAIYRRFGLNDRQIEILARATPKRDYYCQSARGNRLFELGLGDVALAFCGASSKADQAAIAEVLSEHSYTGFAAGWLRREGLDWAADLLTEKPSGPESNGTVNWEVAP